MNRTARTVAILLTALAVLAGGAPAANASGVPLPGPVDQLVNRVSLGSSSCVPTPSNTIHDPTNESYYRPTDTRYYWHDFAETWVNCPNIVTITVQLSDEALDGSSLPTVGDLERASGPSGAGQTADLDLDIANVVLAQGPQHLLTMVMNGSQTNGTVTTTWCAVRRWTYYATLAGPVDIKSTSTQDC